MKDSKLLHIPFRELFSDGSFLYFIVSLRCMHINRLLVLLPPCPRDVLGWKVSALCGRMLVIHGKLLTRLRSGLSVRCY